MSYRGKVHGLINDGCESSSNTGRGTSDCDGLDTAPSLVCYLMRGLPSTGKSYTARRLAGDTGIVCETDEFFRTQVGSDPNVYDYDSQRLVEARAWNFSRFRAAIDRGVSSVVVDRGNGLSQETRRYAIYAREHNYRVEMAEPDSEWWAEVRVLLKYRQYTAPILKDWAVKLAGLSRTTHQVSARKIWARMQSWRHGLQVEDILSLNDDVRIGPDQVVTHRGGDGFPEASQKGELIQVSIQSAGRPATNILNKNF